MKEQDSGSPHELNCKITRNGLDRRYAVSLGKDGASWVKQGIIKSEVGTIHSTECLLGTEAARHRLGNKIDSVPVLLYVSMRDD